MYCNNNPVMYSDESGHMPKWSQWVLGGLIVVAGIGISIATGGIASALMAGATSVWASIGIGATAGAIGGAVSGFAVSVGTQAISGGFENIDYGKTGISAATGAIFGAIAGGIFGGIKYAIPARGIGESISGVKTAQAAINYNNAYSAFIMASFDCEIVTLVSGLIYSGMQFGVKTGIGELVKLTGWI